MTPASPHLNVNVFSDDRNWELAPATNFSKASVRKRRGLFVYPLSTRLDLRQLRAITGSASEALVENA